MDKFLLNFDYLEYPWLKWIFYTGLAMGLIGLAISLYAWFFQYPKLRDEVESLKKQKRELELEISSSTED